MTDRPIPTKERLAHALIAMGDLKLLPLIRRARQGYYDDFEADIAFPIIQLVHDLEAIGHPELAQRAKDGEWDGTPEESDRWIKSEVLKDPELAELARKLGML